MTKENNVCIVRVSPKGEINLYIPKGLFEAITKTKKINKVTVTLRLLSEA